MELELEVGMERELETEREFEGTVELGGKLEMVLGWELELELSDALIELGPGIL